ncbi:5'-nucleotidase C-terminal domain-containing protein [Paracoccus aerodenitrificans]|uniref:5'-nucleotidase C-terminal domain-containing protein n=1 Tax=Paracoccus aerodenitrificans TaxID=3017781 RepID=UPI0022F12512|nr:5'-nucleotidase C-terminal domain-containing protein [Paracoccus aerodenitrificans]WBU65219.1 5'-nucleotidase C-terminal domain-containing protein [Paracoccus aerodenitrificans]
MQDTEIHRKPIHTTRKSRQIVLRILATTDLHMRLDASETSGGLARLAPLIAAERERFDNVLLFDNGDLIEGSALADEIARAGLGAHESHPAIAALNLLCYDAATLGNHDFSQGIGFLRRVLRDAAYPVTLANAGLDQGAMPWTESVVLTRELPDTQGDTHRIAIGVFGVLPPQTVEWEPDLSREMRTEDISDAAKRAVSSLRAQGVDAIIALSHGGYGSGGQKRAENAAGAIAELPAVDAVIAGHTHEVFVRPATESRAAIVEAGFGGSHLAAMTLTLHGAEGHWQVKCAEATTIPAANLPCPRLSHATAFSSSDIEKRLEQAITHSNATLTSHYALLGVDPCLRLVEAALLDYMAEIMPDAAPPLVSIAPFRTGGRGGPKHFINIPAGPLTLADLSHIYPFPNYIAAIPMTGAEITDWLERTARLFRHIRPEETDARLIDPEVPGFQADMIGGLDYHIDLTCPAGFDAPGNRIDDQHRIRDLSFQGVPISASDRFTLVTNSYRMAGGQPYAALTRTKTCLIPEIARLRIRDLVARHLAGTSKIIPDLTPWFRFSASHATRAVFETAPDADPRLCPVPAQQYPASDEGFRRFSLSFQAGVASPPDSP